MRRKRRFINNSIQHIYQRSIDGGVIFYDVEDYLVAFTIFSIYARKYKVKILSICLMDNHFHILINCSSKWLMSSYMQVATSVLAKHYNSHFGRKGSLFNPLFGSASKVGDKKARTTIAYLYNNPVEKHLCKKAEEYRWNFMAYCENLFPFSRKKNKSNMSNAMRDALKLIDRLSSDNQYLKYQIIGMIFNRVKKQEDRDYLIDYIISSYSVIDYKELMKYFKDYDTFKTAIDSNTGSEYDIKELYEKGADIPIKILISLAAKIGFIGTKKNFYFLNGHEVRRLVEIFINESRASYWQIAKFLHLSKINVIALSTMR